MTSLFSRVCSFAHFSRLERAVLTIVAHDARQREIRDLESAFKSLDIDKAGWLTRDGICQALNSRGIRLRDNEVEAAFEALDPDGDDKVQYTDWLAATIRPSFITSERALREVWHFFDIHGVGKVFLADIAEVLGEDMVSLELPEGLRVGEGGEIAWESFQKLLTHVAANLQRSVDAQVEHDDQSRRASRRWMHSLASRRVASSVRYPRGRAHPVSDWSEILRQRSKSR